jgi:multidrug efflux system outer membrane protein
VNRLACASLLLLCSCAVGPRYERPEVDPPERYRAEVTPEAAASFADLPWWEVFGDPTLRELVENSLAGNWDIQIAVQRSEQARQQVGGTRSAFFPQLSYMGSGRRSHSPINQLAGSQEHFNSFLGVLDVAWEIDLWGRIRRANQAARAQMLATEAAQRGVLLSLVSQVATLYFQLLELDAELRIAKETVETFENTLELFTRRYRGGIASKLEVSRAAAALAQTEALVPGIIMASRAVENQLSVLQGLPPADVPRGARLEEQQLPTIAPGLPSQLLERRPDIEQAEQGLVAANAEIGVAIGNFLPRVGLSALWGGASRELSDLAKGSANIWNLAGEIAGPIFQGGLLYAQYQAQLSLWEEAKAVYERAALFAFAEVSDALTARQYLAEQSRAQRVRTEQLEESVRLSLTRYRQGLASYFEVLQAQQDLLPARLELAQTRFEELRAVVDLYRSLGGGWELGVQWQEPAPEVAAPPDTADPTPQAASTR